ncbi:MAG TPA: outer membrane beta-barrel protein [Mucilaginibacter sp.]
MKKNLILMTAFLFILKVSNAQTEKGSQNLEFNLGFSYNKSNNFMIQPYDNSSMTLNNTNGSFNIGPGYSYFIADKLDIGTSLSYGGYKSSSISNDHVNNNNYPTSQSNKSYAATVYVRKYVMFQNKFGFRVGPYLNYTRGNYDITYIGSSSNYNNTSNSNVYMAGINLGLVYYPSKKLGLSAMIGNLSYEHIDNNNTNEGHSTANQIDFGFINNGLSLSVFYVFGS